MYAASGCTLAAHTYDQPEATREDGPVPLDLDSPYQISKGESGDVYNLASGVETTILELAKLIVEMAGSPTPVELAPRRDWDHSGKRFGSTEKARKGLGFEAVVPLKDGLARTVEWTRQNLYRVDECIQKHAERLSGKDLAELRLESLLT